ncbi:redox-regulated ATPase YchF [Candidatus Woesearchaeota archaeon]|nr:MAG: redox-regulated ATPase YchF [Candidatus Woesearchaeota archaeon]
MLLGVIGKPNTGKSTFFKALTLADVLIANYPFATIKPNHGMGFVKIDCADSFFNVQCNPREGFCINHKRFVPVELIDVAGLVPGAHEGKGMGNQFLDDLNQAHALIHVIDAAGSTNEKGEPVPANSYDPVNDVKFLEEELDYWYAGILKRGWEKFARKIQQEQSDVAKALGKQLSGLRVTEDMVKEMINTLKLDPVKPANWTEDQLMQLSTMLRKRTKPMIIAANKIDVSGAKQNLERLKKQFPDYVIIGCSAESELALKEAARHKVIEYTPGENKFTILSDKLNDKQKQALQFIQELLDQNGSTGAQEIINKAVFDVLQYIAIFPGGLNKLEDQYGNILPDCFLLPPKTTALQFAFNIHTDLGEHFIKAIDVKTKRAVGKEHLLKNLDVVEIITSK